MPHRILIIEDDRDFAHLVEIPLMDMGYEVTLAHEGHAGLDLALSKAYDLIILDLMLPDVDGLEICRRVRAGPFYTPMVILAPGSSELDRVLGLETGADDYLTEPFGVRELLARIKGLIRRTEAIKSEVSRQSQRIIGRGDLAVDVEKRNVELQGKRVLLTAKEFDLLFHLVSHPGRAYTRAELLNLVWRYGHTGYRHTVDSHINRLRAKIEKDPAKPRYVLTLWGIGYKFSDAEDLEIKEPMPGKPSVELSP
jgi:DNA-binding response OmpR family regulator